MLKFSFDFNLFNNQYFIYERLLVTLFALVPTIMLVIFTLKSDKKSSEPKKNIVICLLSGILTISLAQFFESMTMPYFKSSVVLTFIWAMIEELSKIAIFYLFIFDNKYYDDIYDGVVYMMLIALSFAGLENLIYTFSESTVSDSISLALIRDLTTIPLHVICGIVIGYFISLGSFSKDDNKKYVNFLLAVIIPSLMHGIYNNLMSFLGSFKLTTSFQVFMFEVIPLLLIVIILFYIAFRVLKKTIELNNIFDENGEYEKKYSYLVTKDEYMNSEIRKRRIEINNKISFNKEVTK